MRDTAERETIVANTPTDVIPVTATERVVHANPEPQEVWAQLPGGVERTIKVDSDEIGLSEATPFRVIGADGKGVSYSAGRIEGPCELVHTIGSAPAGCRPRGSAHIVTTAPLSVRSK